jgi:hypothetical protein
LSLSESPKRHVFLATSDTFKSNIGHAKDGPLVEGLEIYGGVDGRKGSGLHSVNWGGEGPCEIKTKPLKAYNADTGTIARAS